MKDYFHIYFSPHPDDAILSCGATIINQVKKEGMVLVVTVFSRPSTRRRKEDKAACQLVGADFVHLPFTDAYFRQRKSAGKIKTLFFGKYLYRPKQRLFGRIKREDKGLMEDLKQNLRKFLKKRATFYFPLAIGNHVDHQILFIISRDFLNEEARKSILFYEDFPYCLSNKLEKQLRLLEENGFELREQVAEGTNLLENKISAIRVYTSQVKELFGHEAALKGRLWQASYQIRPINQSYFERFWRPK